MPYSLNFASGGTVSFTPKALRGTWAWELELEVPNTTNQRAINFNDNNFRYLRANSGFWELRNNLSGLPDVVSTTPVTLNTRTVVRVEATADEASWFIDGTPQGVIGTQTNDFILNNLNNTGNFTGKVYRFEVWENGILVESRIKQTLTSGNDRVYTDNVGTNDGALDATFPADNSQWELFDAAAGVTADVAYTVNSPSVSASASATVPAQQADIAFSVSPPSVSVSASATLHQPASDIAFTVNTPSVAANASVTLPGYNATVSFNVSAPSVSANASATLPNPSADVIYTVSTPVVSASASATLPSPISDIAFSVSAPNVSVSATATQQSFNANVAFTVNAPTVSISASATLPQPESTVSFAVSPPSVSVVAIVGGIAIIVDEETNINQRVLSNNINAPILSNNING